MLLIAEMLKCPVPFSELFNPILYIAIVPKQDQVHLASRTHFVDLVIHDICSHIIPYFADLVINNICSQKIMPYFFDKLSTSILHSEHQLFALPF